MPTAPLPLTTVRFSARRWCIFLAAFALVAGHVAMALSASRSKSVAFDELAHVTAGAAYWLHGDFRLQPENGNFPQRWAAIPFLFLHPKFPPTTDPSWAQPDVWGLGAAFLSRNANDPDQLLFAARAMIALLGAATVALVFWWARELHGTGGGFVALGLAAFCPALLAHGAIATSDLALACTLLLATWTWWRLLQRITAGRVLASVAAVALLFLTKMSAPLFVPVAALLAGVRLAAGRAWRVDLGTPREWRSRRPMVGGIAALGVVHALVAWATIWAAYDFRFAAAPPSLPDAHPLPFDFEGDFGWPVRVLHVAASARLLPQAYLYGYEWVLRASAFRYAFFNGEHGFGGWPTFFPYLFLVKMPLACFALLALASWQIVRRCTAGVRDTLYALAPLLALVLVFGTAALTTRLNIGHRHILPLLPPLYILAGAAWPAGAAARLWHRLGVAALVLAFAVESWLVRPHYLAFFNAFAGGPDRAWRHVVDSSLDWGMDLPALRDWLRQNRRPDEPVHFGYFGMGTPADYDIPAVSLTTYYGAESRVIAPLQPGLFVVSVTLLQVYAPAFGPWNKAYEARYQEAIAALEPLYAASPAQRERLLADKGAAYWTQAHRTLNDLRFARLCAWLRQRPPLAQVAHTLLVWRLGEQDLFEAQYGPPAELAEAPVAFRPGAR
jgi:4-amino-4-deoxy-L-arabinose transferase-like glycosyltransferase